MGLFKKSKKIEFPKFPEVPRFEPIVPKYEPTLSKIKQEVGGVQLEEPRRIEIPERKPVIVEKHIVTRPPVEAGKPIFVKIDNYKEALEILEEIKRKVREAETIFSEVERIREDRDKKIDAWKADLAKIKERLIAIDRKLFEV